MGAERLGWAAGWGQPGAAGQERGGGWRQGGWLGGRRTWQSQAAGRATRRPLSILAARGPCFCSDYPGDPSLYTGHTLTRPRAALRIKAGLLTAARPADGWTDGPADLRLPGPLHAPDPPHPFCQGAPAPGQRLIAHQVPPPPPPGAFSGRPSLLHPTPCLVVSPGHAVSGTIRFPPWPLPARLPTTGPPSS